MAFACHECGHQFRRAASSVSSLSKYLSSAATEVADAERHAAAALRQHERSADA
jgi:hypothetical protein